MEGAFVKVLSGLLVTVILGLIGLVWGMRKEELDRRERSAKELRDEQEKRTNMAMKSLKDAMFSGIADLNNEIIRLRDERHKNTTQIAEAHGLCHLLRDDLDRLADRFATREHRQ